VEVLTLNGDEVERLLDRERLLDALADAFKALSKGEVSVPPRVSAEVPDAGFLGAMPGYVPGVGLAVKLVSVFPHNHDRGLPSHQALITLFDADSGSPQCVMDGTHITAFRTAAGAALSTRHLAREDSRVLALIGAGVQGHAHLRIFPHVRDFETVRIASRTPEHARELAAEHEGVTAVASFEEAVRDADVVCMCTHAGEPVVRYEWLRPGTHVTSVGYAPPKGELDPEIARRGHLFVEGRVAFNPPPAGCGELVGIKPESATEMGELLLGLRPGRLSDEEITVYKSMGHAVEDAAAAGIVYRGALELGVGRKVSF
jgi:ornithine cyclodeaminase/alanine dehydrogenase-like protein (mu-crystallin family)